jgi:hypothetical protein
MRQPRAKLMCHHSASADCQQPLAGDVAARCQSPVKQVLIAKPMKSQSKPLTPIGQAFLFHAQRKRIFSQCGVTITICICRATAMRVLPGWIMIGDIKSSASRRAGGVRALDDQCSGV